MVFRQSPEEHPVIRAHSFRDLAENSEISALTVPIKNGAVQIGFERDEEGKPIIDEWGHLHIRSEDKQVTISRTDHEPLQVEQFRIIDGVNYPVQLFRHAATRLILTHIVEDDWRVSGFDTIVDSTAVGRHFLNKIGDYGREHQSKHGVIHL